MEFRILGPVEAGDPAAPLPLGGPRHRALLAVLLLQAGRVVPRAQVIEALWGNDAPIRAPDMLYVRVAELRKMLGVAPDGAGLVVTCKPGYMLTIDADQLDANRFERIAAEGRQAMHHGERLAACARFQTALALWRGPALADVADSPFAQIEITRLEELRLQVREYRFDAELAQGGHNKIIPELEAAVAAHPLRERFRHQLMLSLYRAGRQSEALQSYRVATRLLVDELGIEPGPELQQLHSAVLRQEPTLALPVEEPQPEPPNNLPIPLTSFVGRETELPRIDELLRVSRLITLTGTGGVGKSRLALEVATRFLWNYPDGVWLVELAAIDDPALVAREAAIVLGVPEHPECPLVDLLVQHLRSRHSLLVLDNCEHQVEAISTLIGRLLAGCRRLHVLATSRERLGLTGEVLEPVGGLRMPDPTETDPGRVCRAAAVRLLVDRARAVGPRFRLTDATAPTIARISRHLDGIPLALELAAAHSNALGWEEIADRLADRNLLLVSPDHTWPPRHRTLQAVVEWSYDLLDDSHRHLFDQLGVFVASFTLDAAEAVCTIPIAPSERACVSEMLSRLVDKSLVSVHAAGSSDRYHLLETLWLYARTRLGKRGETDELRARHAYFFRGLAEAAYPGLRGPDQRSWLERLENEHDNLRAALEWSLTSGDSATAVRMAGALYPFWDLHGHHSEGRRWLTLALESAGPISSAAQVRAHLGVAMLSLIQGDLAQGVTAGEHAAAVSRDIHDDAQLAHAMQYLAWVSLYRGEFDRSDALLGESLRLARSVGAAWEEGWALLYMSMLALARGDYRDAWEIADSSEAALHPVGDPEALAWTELEQAASAWACADASHAAAPLRSSLATFWTLRGHFGLSHAIAVAALVSAARGDWRRSVALFGAAESLRESTGTATVAFVESWIDEAANAATAALGKDQFDTEWRRGYTASLDEVVRTTMNRLLV